MKNSIILFSVIFLSSVICSAQTQFQLAIGGTNNDEAYSIRQTTDGGYAVGGYTLSFGAGNNDFYIIKLTGSGTLQWSKTVGGTATDFVRSIIQTTDGGYAVAGFTGSFGAGGFDMYIIKLDAGGTPQWSKTLGGTGNDYATSIIQITDGGYAVAGNGDSFGAGNRDIYIVKLDGSGTLQWSKTVGGTGDDRAYPIIRTTDGGYAVAGYTNSFGAGGYDMYIVKLDGSGTLQWSRTLGGTGDDFGYSIIQTTDGGYAVAGETISFGAGSYDFYIVKLDGSGTLLWSKTVGGGSSDAAYSIIQTTDGGYATAGETVSFGAGGNDFYIVKLDAGGTLQWSKTIGGAGNDIAYSIIQTTDGGYAVAGYTNSFGGALSDMYIVKLDASGNTCANSSSPPSISGTGGTLGSTTPTVTTPTPTVTSPTSSTSTGGTVTILCFVPIQPISNELPNSYQLYQNYPNPFNPTTKIRFASPRSSFVKIVVYDALGREVETVVNEQLNAATYEVEWNASDYPSGLYYYKLTADDYTESRKMILLK